MPLVRLSGMRDKAMAAIINVLSSNARVVIGIALSGIGNNAYISFHLRPDIETSCVLELFVNLNVSVQNKSLVISCRRIPRKMGFYCQYFSEWTGTCVLVQSNAL